VGVPRPGARRWHAPQARPCTPAAGRGARLKAGLLQQPHALRPRQPQRLREPLQRLRRVLGIYGRQVRACAPAGGAGWRARSLAAAPAGGRAEACMLIAGIYLRAAKAGRL